MFCKKCGMKLSEGAAFCNRCGTPVNKQINNYSVPNSGRITTIFQGVMYQKDKGSMCELILWIGVCVAALIALLAGILVEGGRSYLGGIRAFWIILFFASLGYGTLLLLRLRTWTILYGVSVFPMLLLIFYYLCENKLSYLFMGSNKPVSLVLLFILVLLVAIGLVTCVMIHTFSQQYYLQKVIMILSIVTMASVFLFSIGSYALSKHSYKSQRQEHWEDFYEDTYDSDRTIRKHVDNKLDDEMDEFKTVYKSASNGVGSMAYVLLCLISGMYAIAFYQGIIDNEKQKITISPMPGGVPGGYPTGGMPQMNAPVLDYLQGTYAGRSMTLQGEIIIGSDPGVAQIVVQDPLISRQHCRIRYNVQRGCFEVCDLSKNGVFLQGGARLQNGMYVACARGTILYLSSNRQVIRLR